MTHPAEAGTFATETASPREARRYLAALIGILAVVIGGILVWGLRGRDHFAQIPLGRDFGWYENYAHLHTREMQDRDILVHGIGRSVEHLQRADIVLLGHSVLQYAIRDDQVRAFEAKHGVRIFNLSNPGVASGAYVRQLIKTWKVRPRIWVINVDDWPTSFFNPVIDDHFSSGRNKTTAILQASKLTGYLITAGRNIRWRLEKAAVRYGPSALVQHVFPVTTTIPETWRSVGRGNFALESLVAFRQSGPLMKPNRTEPCPVGEEEIGWARRYLAAIGGASILTFVPTERWCPSRAPDLARALDVETFRPDTADFSAFDGTHMTREGATAYTEFFLAALERTAAFQAMRKNPGPPGADETARGPFAVCVPNEGPRPLHVRTRASEPGSDRVVEPGGELRLPGSPGERLCSSIEPFGPDRCPNARSHAAAACP